jgi:hypothetical protein
MLVSGTAYHVFLRFLKSASVVALLVFLQVTFSRTWVSSLGLARLERFGKTIARRRNLSIVVVGLTLLVVRSAVIPVSGIPLPHYHDEFSYLLAGDTFAQGRLTNPPHPMWIHFETFHVIWHPTYMSMYPPGEGLVLALGEVLGNPWIGQLLAATLMCAAICWMLQGWLPLQWAFLGGVLTLPRLGLLSYWTNGYWSACLPALGGAIILGALPRIKRRPRSLYAAMMALGFFILANTRPYEGFILSLGVAIALLVWMLGKDSPPLRLSLSKVVFPILLILAPLAVWTGFYNRRVTGNAFRMAYDLNRETYAMGRYFIWQTAWPRKTYSNAKIEAQYERELEEFRENQTLHGFIRRARIKLYYFWQVYMVPPLPFLLIGLPCAARDRKLRVPWIIGVFFIIALAVETWGLPHYSAPATALLFLLSMQCMRHLRLFRWRKRAVGLAFVRAVCFVYIGTVVLRVALAVTHLHPESEWQHGDMQREAIVQQLDRMPGQHVVLVNYSPDFDLDREWVYNRADIDGSKIVWARDLGTEKNPELLNYYRGRQFWMVNAGSSQVEPYRGTP